MDQVWHGCFFMSYSAQLESYQVALCRYCLDMKYAALIIKPDHTLIPFVSPLHWTLASNIAGLKVDRDSRYVGVPTRSLLLDQIIRLARQPGTKFFGHWTFQKSHFWTFLGRQIIRAISAKLTDASGLSERGWRDFRDSIWRQRAYFIRHS